MIAKHIKIKITEIGINYSKEPVLRMLSFASNRMPILTFKGIFTYLIRYLKMSLVDNQCIRT